MGAGVAYAGEGAGEQEGLSSSASSQEADSQEADSQEAPDDRSSTPAAAFVLGDADGALDNSVAVLGEASAECDTQVQPPPGEGEKQPGGDNEPGDGGEPGSGGEEPPYGNAPEPGDDGSDGAGSTGSGGDGDSGEDTPSYASDADEELPFTGINLGSLLALALGVLSAGGALVVTASRRMRGQRS